ncbi:unnamed protein product [Paramecium sonneborni]|uniref:Protein kinase domain-containing protein n=1 Tax=Paramecium sonneborni TaxID=65129 RepID=A0A8S1JU43_9CILI|nr:unnamed protein product [Paramecium sonneborni]
MKKYSQKYQIEERENSKLGQGAFGSVFTAKSLLDNNLNICVKVMKKKKQFGENVLQTSQAPEFDICKRMRNKSNENLVKIFDVYDSDIEDEHAYIFMEKCEQSLTAYMKNQQITKELLLNIIYQIAKGYQSLIKENIIHRDLKPENILCNQINGQLQIKIADFGLSKVLDSESEQDMTKKIGTPYYTAPEILDVKNKEIYDNRCDIFSLGVIILDLASGGKQFKYKEIEKLKSQGFSQLYSDIIKSRKIDQEIVELLNKMIVYEIQQRISWKQLFQYFDDKRTNQKQLSDSPIQPIIQQHQSPQTGVQQQESFPPKHHIYNTPQQNQTIAQEQKNVNIPQSTPPNYHNFQQLPTGVQPQGTPTPQLITLQSTLLNQANQQSHSTVFQPQGTSTQQCIIPQSAPPNPHNFQYQAAFQQQGTPTLQFPQQSGDKNKFFSPIPQNHNPQLQPGVQLQQNFNSMQPFRGQQPQKNSIISNQSFAPSQRQIFQQKQGPQIETGPKFPSYNAKPFGI